MTDLPTRMREAAETLIEANYRYTGCSEAQQRQMEEDKWNAVKLRHWADQWQAEDADREALIDRLMDDKRFAVDAGRRFADSKFTLHSNTIREILADYDIKKK